MLITGEGDRASMRDYLTVIGKTDRSSRGEVQESTGVSIIAQVCLPSGRLTGRRPWPL